MTRRRTTYIARTVAAALLATLSLGARQDEWKEPTPETCETNLEAVFDWCGGQGNALFTYVAEEETDACEAGCVMALCPEQISCAELDPMSCAPSCADPQGARYWANAYAAFKACNAMFDHPFDEEDELYALPAAQLGAYLDAYEGCLLGHIKQQCPEFTWWRQPLPPDDLDE